MIFENGPVRSGLRPNKNPLDTFPCPRVHIHGSTLIFTHWSLNAGYGAISSVFTQTPKAQPRKQHPCHSSGLVFLCIFHTAFPPPGCSLSVPCKVLVPSKLSAFLIIASKGYLSRPAFPWVSHSSLVIFYSKSQQKEGIFTNETCHHRWSGR